MAVQVNPLPELPPPPPVPELPPVPEGAPAFESLDVPAPALESPLPFLSESLLLLQAASRSAPRAKPK